MPRKIFYYHPETGEIGASEDVTDKSRVEHFTINFQMLNRAKPGWVVVDSEDEAEMARVRSGL